MTPAQIYAVLDATWPAFATTRHGAWLIREGRGGGQRAIATTAMEPGGDIAQAEAAMAALGQTALFMIREGDADLDAALAARGYVRHDPVVIYAAPVADLAAPAPPPMAAFAMWPPLSIAQQLWVEAGMEQGRLDVMDRAKGPQTSILGRVQDRAAGVAYVACHGDTAMMHALEVMPAFRRQGTAGKIMRKAAAWAQDAGAQTLCLAVTEGNVPARGLYASLGMRVVGRYHYRKQG
jgi:ribosomal protein S18 acetylase RimI-like enzyme